MNELDTYFVENREEIANNSDGKELTVDTDKVAEVFDHPTPDTTEYWQRVWEETPPNMFREIDLDEELRAAILSFGTRRRRVQAAIEIGIATRKIIPTADRRFVLLPLLTNCYSRYLSERQIRIYQQYETWQRIWDATRFHEDASIHYNYFTEIGTPACERNVAYAAVSAGVDADVLTDHTFKVSLGEPTVPLYWKKILHAADVTPHSGIERNQFIKDLYDVHRPSKPEAEATIKHALQANLVYFDKQNFYINSPRDDIGPPIDESAFEKGTYPLTPTEEDDDKASDDKEDNLENKRDRQSENGTESKTENRPTNLSHFIKSDQQDNDEVERSGHVTVETRTELDDTTSGTADSGVQESNRREIHNHYPEPDRPPEERLSVDKYDHQRPPHAVSDPPEPSTPTENNQSDASSDQLDRERAIRKFGLSLPDPDERGIPYFQQFLNLHSTTESPDSDEADEPFVTTSDLRDTYNTWAAIQKEYAKQTEPVDEPDIETEITPQKLGNLVNAHLDVERGQKRIEGGRARVYYGVRLTTNAKRLLAIEI